MRVVLLASLLSLSLAEDKPDWYEVLGVARDSTQAAIKRAYKNLALQKHPDKNLGREQEAAAELAKVNNAYEVLKDSEKRAEYDEYGHETPEERMRIDPKTLFQNSDVMNFRSMADFKIFVQAQPNVALDAEGVWIVDFYMNGCAPCHAFAPEFKKLAARLHGVAHAAAVACGRDGNELCQEQGIESFPTMMLYRWRRPARSRRSIFEALRYPGQPKLANALAWVQMQLESPSTNALAAHGFLARAADSLQRSIQAAAQAGNATLLFAYDSTDGKRSTSLSEAQTAALALSAFARPWPVDCAGSKASDYETPPLCRALLGEAAATSTLQLRLYHAGAAEGVAYDGKVLAPSIIDWAAPLIAPPLLPIKDATLAADPSAAGAVLHLLINATTATPMDQLLLGRIERAMAGMSSLKVQRAACQGFDFCARQPVTLRLRRAEQAGESWYASRLRHPSEIVRWVQRELSSKLVVLDAASFTAQVQQRTKQWLVLFRNGWCEGCEAAASQLNAALPRVLPEDERAAVVDCALEPTLCEDEAPSTFPSARVYYISTDGTHAVDAVPTAAWRSRATLAEELRALVQSPVRRLASYAQWQQLIGARTQGWLVLYTAGEWCGPCTQITPTFRNAALTLKGSHEINTATVSCDAEASDLCQRLRIDGYPLVMYYPVTDGKPSGNGVSYQGFDRSSGALVQFATRGWLPSRVQQLSHSTFASQIDPRSRKQGGRYSAWVLLFTAGQWCGPCMQLEPEVKDVAAQAHERAMSLKVGRVDCDRMRDLCGQVGVQSFPHLVYLPTAAHSQSWADHSMVFDGRSRRRDAKGIFEWAWTLHETHAAPEVSSIEQLQKMRVKQLKKLVMAHGFDCKLCAEKHEFVEVITKGLGLKEKDEL